MPGSSYERLSFLDSTFLALEAPSSHMHVSSIMTFETGSLGNSEGGVDIDRIRRYVSSRLHAIPRYRQTIGRVPLENHPIWLDDHDFNIEYHVRHTCLPKPGDGEQLKLLAGRIMSQQLDRAKPLWEMWVVEGLDGGDRFALINKVHHCMIDGVSGVDLMKVLLAAKPTDEIDDAPAWKPRPLPSGVEVLRDEVLRWAAGPATLLGNVSSVLGDALDPRSDFRSRLRQLTDSLSTMERVRPTPLNKPIGPHRRFEWAEMALGDVKKVKEAFGGTLNDVVLAIVAGAIGRYLARRGVRVRGLDFRVMTPVSVREDGERGTLGNRVSGWIVPMPIADADPRLRVRRISEITSRLRESKQALGADVLMQVGEWTPSTLLSLGARLVTRRLPFHLIVTNVPGPQFPLYLLGSRMRDNYGQVPLTDYLGAGIVLFSYEGRLCWGFNADWDVVPDIALLKDDVVETFQEMLETAGAH